MAPAPVSMAYVPEGARGGDAASILPFLPLAELDDHTIRVLCQAFDLACVQLRDVNQPYVVSARIAKSMIVAAKNGERDPVRLCNVGLDSLGSRKPRGAAKKRKP
jgi:hypothetical protein